MRRFLLVAIILIPLVSLVSFAAAPDLENLSVVTSFNENLIPTIDKSEMPLPADPSFFRKLRQEVQKVEMELAKKNQGEGTKHVLRHVKANFVPDSITFAIAGGAVYFAQLQTVTKSDPALMVKHLEALKDPIAHISFGAFMVANGLYIDMKSRGLDPMTKQLVMKTLTYKGMAVGSFASSVTADLLVTMKECTGQWILNKNDEESHAACDSVYKQWTVRNKFVQYSTQILALLAAQKGAEYVEGLGKMGGRFLKPGLHKLDSKTVKFFKLTSANLDMVITGGGGLMVKSVRWLGKLTKFTMFLAVDHVLNPTISRIGNNLLQPLFFDWDAIAINRYLIHGGEKFPEEVMNFTERMAAWRMHLNGKAEADLAGWLEAVSQLLHQVDYAKTFYLKYLENIYDTFNRQYLVQQGEFNDAPEAAWARERRYPYRTLPLYGVKSNHDYGDVSENDIYLLKPYDIEPYQSQNVKDGATRFLADLNKYNLTVEHSKVVTILIRPLTRDMQPYAQGVQLDRINKFLNNLPKHIQNTRAGHHPDPNYNLKKALTAFRALLGNPLPQLHEGSGFNMAFDTHVTNYQISQEAKFDLSNDNYKFSKASDYMMYSMICGPQQTQIEEGMLSGINLHPPRITNYREELDICKDTWFKKTVTSANVNQMPITVDGVKYENLTRFIGSRINSNLIGNYRDWEKADKGKGFDQWWTGNILPSLQQALRQLDTRYQQLVEMTYQQVNDQKSFGDFAIDWYTNQSHYLDRNIGDNLRYEFEVYLAVLKNILLEEKVTSMTFMKDLAEKSRKQQFDITYVSDKNIESKTKQQQLHFRLQELEMNYKEYMFLLRKGSLTFEELEQAKEKLFNSNNIIIGPFKQAAELMGAENLPTQAQTVLAVANGLEALELDVNRYLLMKIKLGDRLEIDLSKLNQFMKAQSIAPTQKRGNAPHGQ